MTRSLALGLVWLLFAPPLLQAQGSEGAAADESAIRRTAERLKTLHEEAEHLVTQERGLLNQLRQLELARQIANEELKQANAATTATAAEMTALDEQVTRLESERDAERPKLESRLVEMYKLGRDVTFVCCCRPPTSARSGRRRGPWRRWRRRIEQRVIRYERRLTELASARQSLSGRQEELSAKRASAARAQGAASKAIAAQAALVREIDQRRDLNAQLASELMASQVRLENTLRTVPSRRLQPLPAAGPFRGVATLAGHRSVAAAIGQRPGPAPGCQYSGPGRLAGPCRSRRNRWPMPAASKASATW